MEVDIHSAWKALLNEEFEKPYFKELMHFIDLEYENEIVYPSRENIFSAFHFTPLEEVKVIILGQDPYHGPDQANGLSFSVPRNVKSPPSLKNILKELHSEFPTNQTTDGDLTHWAKQGVLLLNTSLTVRAGKAGSHQKKGWEKFTDEVIKKLNQKKENLVFILWGAHAQKKIKLIDTQKHFIIQSVHPSPLSSYRGFFGSKPFSKTNTYLKSVGKTEIEW